ncbi:hypothetical protein [Jannaschia sp. R86511]|uniref:hypothetical protein n=1 Tax=Jannaschia sp. R86511 TaxID=3093853 RepID=UPI0036D39D45
MAAGLTSTGTGGGVGGVAPGRVDVVVWARALGVRNADEVWEHVIKTSADIGRVMDDLSAVVQRMAEYPDDELRTDLLRAFGLIDNVGHEVLRVARSTHAD